MDRQYSRSLVALVDPTSILSKNTTKMTPLEPLTQRNPTSPALGETPFVPDGNENRFTNWLPDWSILKRAKRKRRLNIFQTDLKSAL